MEELQLWSNCALIAHRSLEWQRTEGNKKPKASGMQPSYCIQTLAVPWNSVEPWKGPEAATTNKITQEPWGSQMFKRMDSWVNLNICLCTYPLHTCMAIDAQGHGALEANDLETTEVDHFPPSLWMGLAQCLLHPCPQNPVKAETLLSCSYYSLRF